MPRKRRFFLPGVPAHIVQRGRSRQPVFFADDDYQAYLHWLVEASERYNLRGQSPLSCGVMFMLGGFLHGLVIF